MTATNRIGEGAASPLVSFKPTRTTEPKIFEFSQSIPFRSANGQGESWSGAISNSLSQLPNAEHSNTSSNGGIAGEQSGQSLPVLLTCTVLSSERVTRKWTMISAGAEGTERGSANSSDSVTLDHEPDGSLLINVNLEHLPTNYSCTVSNSAGSDQVIYHLFKGRNR